MAKPTSKRKSKLLGSCQCGKIHFSVISETPKLSIAAWHERKGWPVSVRP